ncbi:MAG: permease-like cell division protein FtsX [Ancrocorticia sp.]|jgi:cell division transport system permease protein|nr:permease-like cell division protein FtsX [Ancrocorticia sp.]MCI1896546.1 permease-like cell division protein FtsX [Ancrocorticia sp.]MCI1964074.1 permease-like cell division protein FtsX [Ancrocorticia sp.]MCI2001758.1 permease-like cell division protein FtsX [Ancrocorticia sp.]MCI2013070.1 permease-like cell division protein FtsX [Ancrocorticia sp.]
MRFRFILSQTFRGIASNKAMAASVALVTFVSLLFVGAASLLQTQVNNLKTEWYENVEISVYLCPESSDYPQCANGEATQDQIDAISEYLESKEMKPLIESYRFESKEEALENFQKQMAGTSWADRLTKDDMQASFRIKLVDPEKYQIVTDALSGRDGVQSVNDQREQLEPLFNVLNKLTILSSVLAAVMILTGLLLIPTTIRLSAMSRRNETEIMRFVGASNFFIELPFILEGVLSALVGSVLAVAGLWVTVRYFITDWLGSAFTWLRIVDTSNVWFLAPFLVVGAVVVAAFASWVTLRRYARV